MASSRRPHEKELNELLRGMEQPTLSSSVRQQQQETSPSRGSNKRTGTHQRPLHGPIFSLKGIDEQYVLLLDAIDKLKLGSDIDLPEIVVLGDQSEGKSTVLEAIAGVKLPKGDRTCTKCLIRLCIRRGSDVHVVIEFDGKSTDGMDGDFSNTLKSMMDKNFQDRISMKAVIDVRISGPNRPNLTVVDAPGFKSDTQDNDEKENMEALGHKLDNENVLMVVVLKAINDIEASRGYGLASRLDSDFKRTVFVLTHCDNLTENKQKMVADMLLAKNTFAVYCYSEKGQYSSEEEKKFFEEHSFWRGQSSSNLGVDALVSHLAKKMFRILEPRREEIHSKLLNLWTTEDKELQTLMEEADNADRELKRLLGKLNKELEEYLSGTHRKKQNELFSDCKEKWSKFAQALKAVANDVLNADKLKKIVKAECTKQIGEEFDSLPHYFPVLKRVIKKHVFAHVSPIIEQLIGDIECIVQNHIQIEVKKRLKDRELLENFVNSKVREYLPKLRRDVADKIKMIMSMETAVYQIELDEDRDQKAKGAESSAIKSLAQQEAESLLQTAIGKVLPPEVAGLAEPLLIELVQYFTGTPNDTEDILQQALCMACHKYIGFVVNRIANSVPKAMIRFMMKKMSKDISDCISDSDIDQATKEQLKANVDERIVHLQRSTAELHALLLKF